MPGMDGFAVLQRLRERGHTPVLFLTGRDEDADRVHGLDLGADDYLTKPFNSRELLARIHAILRRTSAVLRAGGKLDLGALQIDATSRCVSVAGDVVGLTDAEYRVLEVLANQAGQVVSRAQLTRIALGRPYLGLDRSIDTHVSALRRKLGPTFEKHMTLQSVRGMGYVLCSTPAMPA
jgi:DNA-binding response OmpR family regulator